MRINLSSCIAITGALLGISGCKPGEFTSGGSRKEATATRPRIETFSLQQNSASQLDVAFFVDTSESMKDEAAAVTASLQGFAGRLAGSNAIDYQIFIVGLTSKLSISGGDMSRIDLINSEVNSHSGLWNAYHFLEGHADKVPAGKLQLRAGAVKELVFLTDDDAKNITSREFGSYLDDNAARLGTVHVNGFVGLPSSVETISCKISAIGQSYITLGADKRHGGMIADVCHSNLNVLLAQLADQINTRIKAPSVFTLSGRPENTADMVVKIDGAVFTDYNYDSSTGRISLNLSSVKIGSQQLEVIY